MKGLYIMDCDKFDTVYPPSVRKDIKSLIDIPDFCINQNELKNHADMLKETQIILSSWGAPVMDVNMLDMMPSLKAVFYGAGSVRYFVTDEFWNRGIRLFGAWAANAVPVAEFAFAQIILSLKGVWSYTRTINSLENYIRKDCAGCYKSNVGIISLGMIGRMLCEKLKTLDVKVYAYDPFANPQMAKDLNVTLLSLEELFKVCDVVSLHTPWLKETENMIKKEHFLSMKENSSFINTARGAVVDEEGMISALKERKDIYALLDVTYPEPPEEDSPLYSMENVILTPHIAGALGNERNRIGIYMADELKNYIDGNPLRYEITKDSLKFLA